MADGSFVERDFDHEGFLLLCEASSKNWKLRWCVLEGNIFKFYRAKDASDLLGTLPLAPGIEICVAPPGPTQLPPSPSQLVKKKIVPPAPGNGKRLAGTATEVGFGIHDETHFITIQNSVGVLYYFCTYLVDERDEWVEDLNLAMEFPEKPELEMETNLVVCASSLELRVLKRILRKGMVDVNEDVIHNGNTACHEVAVWCKRPLEMENAFRALLLLQRYGASFNVTNHNGESPLHVACSSRCPHHVKSIALMLKCGADPNILTNDGQSALSLTLEHLNVDFASVLLKSGADPNLAMVPVQVESQSAEKGKRKVKMPSMHVAVLFFEKPQFVRLLLQCRADLYAIDSDGASLEDYIRKRPINPHIALLLREWRLL